MGHKDFKFIIEEEENRKFFAELRESVGIILDEVSMTPLWICIPCKEKLFKDQQPDLNKYLELVKPYDDMEMQKKRY